MNSKLKSTKMLPVTWRYFMIINIIILLNSGCKKWLETGGPTTSITGKNVFLTDPTAIAVLTGIYSSMSGVRISEGELTSVGFLTGLSGDELTLYTGMEDAKLSYYQNHINPQADFYSLWNIIYPKIHTLNSAIEGVTSSQFLNVKIKKQLLGEAKFMRAFCYFYLVNLYGDVPLVTSSDYSVNMALPRAPKNQIWRQIIIDLKDAQDLLSDKYLDVTLLKETSERVRPTKWTATALLARTYLFMEDWKNAELQSTLVINQASLYHLESLNEIFKNTSAEAIWQLQPVNILSNTEDARCYIIDDSGPGRGLNSGGYLSSQLLESFDKVDSRLKEWVGVKNYEGFDYYYPYKYKLVGGEVVNEYHTIFRLAELYLIKAEALAEEGDYSGAINNLDIIRKRAGLPLIKDDNPNISIAGLRSAVLQERRHELFTEWGHRWLDLKRTNKVDEVMNSVAPIKGTIWNSNWQYYPVPSSDILVNRNLTQNPGY